MVFKIKQSLFLFLIAGTMSLCFTTCTQVPVKRPPVPPKDDRGITLIQKMRTQAVSRRVGRWAVVIGISDYKYDTHWDNTKGIPDLKYAHKDAHSFAHFLMSPQGGAFSPDHVLLLTDRKATVNEVRNAIGGFLARSLEDDLVIIFFAGHGVPDPDNPDNLYLACYDTQPGKYYGTAFPMWGIDDALSRTIHSKRVFVFADACHSAGVGGARGNLVSKKFNEYIAKLAGSREGVTKITASREDELSLEKDYLDGGHGVFTYYLLKALKGEADENCDGFVTMTEAYEYLYDQVRSETLHSQNPWASSYISSDIPLGIIDGQVLAAIKDRSEAQKKRPVQPITPYRPQPSAVDLPKDSQVAVKLARAKLAKEEMSMAREMAEAVIARNDTSKPDALALKIAILLKDGALTEAEDTEDLLVIIYPEHPAALNGARLIYDYYHTRMKGASPDEEIRQMEAYLKRHPGGLLEEEAKTALQEIRKEVETKYRKRFDESLTLAKGFIKQNQFDRARKELEQSSAIVQEAFSRYGIAVDTEPISTLQVTAETAEKQYRSRTFDHFLAKARVGFTQGDYPRAYQLLEKAREYATADQVSRADELASHYNAPPEVNIVLDKNTVAWEMPITFTHKATDKEGDPVRIVQWDFGDGTISKEDTPHHAYAKWKGAQKARQYVVTLQVTDGHTTITATKTLTVKRQDCIARDGRFCKYANGTVLDTETNLMWAAKDNGRDVTWQEAKEYCENYRGGGYTDWRMPTQDELAGLYDKNKGYRAKQAMYTVHLTELIELTTSSPWSTETHGSGAALFDFGRGSRWWPLAVFFHPDRALPVRSGN
jgi:tetratricopeptide (TPR) repeat protein